MFSTVSDIMCNSSNNINNLVLDHDFLDVVIENISPTKRNWIILPNKQACISLNKKIELKGIFKTKTHKIKIGVFNSFLEEISGYKIIDDLELVNLLYNQKLHNHNNKKDDINIENKFTDISVPFEDISKIQQDTIINNDISNNFVYGYTQQPFECFYPWGISLLKDFDLVDKSLLEVGTIFSSVNQYKNLEYDFLTDEQKLLIKEFWNKFGISSSDNKKLFFRNCDLIPKLYKTFSKQLSISKKAYTGFILKKICAKINNIISFEKTITDGLITQTSSTKKNEKVDFDTSTFLEVIKRYNLIFAGFSKLYKAEIKILKFLQENYNTKILWDNNPKLQDLNLDDIFQTKTQQETTPLNSPLIYEASSGSDEVTFVVNKILEMLKDTVKKHTLSNSAVVIPNERMMKNIINQCKKKGIPYNAKGTNIRFSKTFIILEETIRKHILDMQNDPTQKKSIINILKKVINNLKINTYDTDLSFLKNKENIFFIEIAENTLNKLEKIFHNKPLYASKEFLYLFKKTIINDSLKLSRNIQANNSNKGISILEIQDTRALDFDYVFILSANETDLPPNHHTISFIPYTLKRAYGIPINKEFENKYYTYLFYRLLYRTKSLIITYRTQGSINSLLEPSRYVLQLIYGSSISCKINKIDTDIVEPLGSNKVINIDKNKDVMEEIYASNILKKGLSASAVNTYLDCGLKFYLQYVKRTKPLEETPSEEQILGNIVHKVLEYIYRQDDMLSSSSLDTHKIHHIVNKAIEEYSTGNSLYKDIYFNVTSKIVNKIIEIDRKDTNYKVLDVEVGKDTPFSTCLELGDSTQVNTIDSSMSILVPFEDVSKKCQYSIKKNDISNNFIYTGYSSTLDEKNDVEITKETQSQKVSIYGIVDRIDINKNYIRLIDYKTGYYDPKIKDIESLFDKDIERNKTAFQLVFYCLILKKKDTYNKKAIYPSVYGIREIFSSNFDPRLKIKQNATYIPIGRALETSMFIDKNSSKIDGKMSCNKVGSSPIEDISPYLSKFEGYLKDTLKEIMNPNIPFSQTMVSKKCMHCVYKNICRR